MHVCVLSLVQLFATSWTVAHQALLSVEFSKQEHWSGLPLPTPGDLPDPGIKHWQADSLPLRQQGKPFRINRQWINMEA